MNPIRLGVLGASLYVAWLGYYYIPLQTNLIDSREVNVSIRGKDKCLVVVL